MNSSSLAHWQATLRQHRVASVLASALFLTLVFGCIVLLAWNPATPVDDAPESGLLQQDIVSQNGWAAFRAIAATIFVLGLVYASLWGYRALGNRVRPQSGVEPLQLQASLRLGANQTLHVVQFGREHLLLAASQAGITLLDKTTVTDASEPMSFDLALGAALEKEQS